MSQSAKLQQFANSAKPVAVAEYDVIPKEIAPVMAVLEKLTYLLTERTEPAAPQLAVWVTLDQASDYLGLSRTLLERMVKDKKLVAIKDRSIKVRKADLDSLVP